MRFFHVWAISATFLFTICLAQNKILSVPLMRMQSPLQKFGAMGIHPSKIHVMLEELMKENEKKTNASIPLFKFLDMEFYGEVLIGHPGQKLNVVFDTAWANSWVISSMCPFTSPACAFHQRYNSGRSSTYIPTGKEFNVPLGKYNLTGRLSTDLFHIGQINVTNQTFAEIIHIPWIYFFSKADGVVGLAFDTYSVEKVAPIFYNMIKQGLVKKQVFSFYMNRDPSTTKGGTLFFGGVEERHFRGNFTFTPVVRVGYWQIHMNGIALKGSKLSLCNGGCSAIIDTSTNIIGGPKESIRNINQFIRAHPFYFGRYVIDCGQIGKLPSITFTIEGKPFILKGKDYVQQMSWGGVMLCLSSFAEIDFPSSYGEVWNLGGSFLSRFYVQFDMENQKVGFAEALL